MTPFIKMHGCGNDFVIIDCREDETRFSPDMAAPMASRGFGIGCDQVIVIRNQGLGIGDREASEHADGKEGVSVDTPLQSAKPLGSLREAAAQRRSEHRIFMQIYNSDGSESDACGNATRCVAWLLMEERSVDECVVVTNVAEIHCARGGEKMVRVDMGVPKFGWNDIPLSRETDTLHLPLQSGVFSDGVGVNMGNPHAVFFVDDLESAEIETHGPILEHHALLPERGNISAVQVINRSEVNAKVWERGSGLTLACGTGACAIAVAGIRRGLLDRKCKVNLPGGTLEIEWCDENSDMPSHVLMSGPAAEVFRGEWLL